MTKYLFIVIILLASSSLTVFGQSKNQRTEYEVRAMICHKWQAITMQVQGESVPMESGNEIIYISFLQNGTLIDFQNDNQTSKDKWTYNHKTMTITYRGAAKKIVKIDDKQLIINSKVDGQITLLTLKRVD